MAAAQKVGRGLKLALLFLATACVLPAANYYLTIAGLGGSAEYDTQFAKWAVEPGSRIEGERTRCARRYSERQRRDAGASAAGV